MNVERVTPKTLEREKAAEYALVVCKEGLGKSGVKTKNLGGGSFGTAVGVTLRDGGEAVVKFLRADGMLGKETHDLRLLSENCGVRMPKVLCSRCADGDIPFDCYIMDKIEGKTLFTSFGKLLYAKSARLDFADRVTDALHDIHECRSDKFGDTVKPCFHRGASAMSRSWRRSTPPQKALGKRAAVRRDRLGHDPREGQVFKYILSARLRRLPHTRRPECRQHNGRQGT